MSPTDPGREPGVVSLRIDGLAAGGRGVGRHEGRVWFVERGLPGDRVLARPIARRARFVEAERVRLERPSPSRRQPPCVHQDRCGGCPWMPLAEVEQRAWKERLVRDALARIGGIADCPVEPTRSTGSPLGYRNRVEFAVAWDESGRATIGLHRAGGGGLVAIDRCLLQSDAANRTL
ncbi:MAG TPA: TRAM domain-containing protein, partial [Candidatus Polarisedimenticolaceae bacterium]|nr:TRAM domain-containing protein [Candidatus Polarisedimenticolaceae bacterium]